MCVCLLCVYIPSFLSFVFFVLCLCVLLFMVVCLFVFIVVFTVFVCLFVCVGPQQEASSPAGGHMGAAADGVYIHQEAPRHH